MLDLNRASFIERTKCINCASNKLSEIRAGNYSDEPLHSFLANDP